MNTKLIYRLAWKEVRSLRPLWLTLLVTAVVLQVGLVWAFDTHHAVANGVTYHPRAMWLIGVLVALPAIFAVASLSMSFAGEREEGTDQFLCRLAAPPQTLLGVKVGLCVASTLAMFALLVIPTNVLDFLMVPRDVYPLMVDPLNPQATQTTVARLAKSHPELTVVFVDIREDSRRVLEICSWILNVLSCGVFFSLLFQRVFSSLIATALAAWLLPRTVLTLLTFSVGNQFAPVSWFEWLIHLGVIPGTLLLASVWLVQTWDENRWPRFVERGFDAWRRVTATSERLAESRPTVQLSGWRPIGLCWPDEWLPAWRREARRLLWLEWRQARRVMLFVLAAFGVYVVCQGLFVAWGSVLIAKEFPFVMALVSFVFGAWSFQAQQSGQRFRDFAGHGASPAAMWCIKQGVWFAATLLTLAVLTPIVSWLSGGRHFVYWESERSSLWRTLGHGLSWSEPAQWDRDTQLLSESLGSVLHCAVLAVGLCFAVGQFVSLLMSRAVTVATVGFVLASLAFGWQQLTAWAAIPPVLAVLPLIVGLLSASAMHMTDWLEQRNSVSGWLKVALAFGVPSLVTLIGVPMYRVAEIPSVSAVASASGWSDLESSLNSAGADVKPGAKRVGEWWMRMAESIEDEPIFVRKVWVNDGPNLVEEESAMISHHLAELHLHFVAWDKLRNRDWLTRNGGVLSEMSRLAPLLDDCQFDAGLFEDSDERANFRFKRVSQLAVLLKIAAEAAIADGKLDEGLQHYLVLLRLSEHMQQHAQWWAVHNGERLEVATWSFLIRWACHPAQTGDSLRAALGRSANTAPHPLLEALKKHIELVPRNSNVVLEEYAVTKQDVAQHWREAGWPASWLFWERQREERLLDFSSAVAMAELRAWVRHNDTWEGDYRLVTRSTTEHHPASRNRDQAAFLQAATRQLMPIRRYSFAWSYDAANSQRTNERGEASAWRRGLIATIALRAFQLDHGRWPTQWDELIGPYLDRVPVDPWSGMPFELRPQGYPFAVEILDHRIPAHTPLFISRGQYHQEFLPIIRPHAKGETANTIEWYSVCPIEVDPQPIKDSTRTLSLIAFPLSMMEP